MAVVTSDFLTGVLTSFRALFDRNFESAGAFQAWPNLAIEMPSDGESNTYEWFGTVPRMKDVSHDTPDINDLPQFNFSITNNEYQAVIEVSRMALERDRLNLVAPRIAQLADEAARHPGELIFNLFESNPDAFDGVAYFSNARTIGKSATIDNILAGTGVTVPTIQADLGSARGAMRMYQDDGGRPMNTIGNTIIVPPSLEGVMWQALAPAPMLGMTPPMPVGNGPDSWVASGYTVIVNPFLVDQTDWYLFSNGGPAKRPFIYQVEKKPVVETDTNPTTRDAIIQRNFLYSVYGRYNVGVTDPRWAVKMVNAG